MESASTVPSSEGMEETAAAKPDLESSLAGVCMGEGQNASASGGDHVAASHSGHGVVVGEGSAAAQTSSAASPTTPVSSGVHASAKKSRPDTWDPLAMPSGAATTWCLRRIKKDLRSLYSDPLPGIFVYVCAQPFELVPAIGTVRLSASWVQVDESDFTIIHALVVGPFEVSLYQKDTLRTLCRNDVCFVADSIRGRVLLLCDEVSR